MKLGATGVDIIFIYIKLYERILYMRGLISFIVIDLS